MARITPKVPIHPDDDRKKGQASSLWNNLFGWMVSSSAAGAEKKDGGEGAHTFRERYVVLLKEHSSYVESVARKAIENLELCKAKMLADETLRPNAFIEKSIDPLIAEVTAFIEELQKQKNEVKGDIDFFEKAIRSVETYSQFDDENSLCYHIINELILSAQQAVDKDCQILRNYVQHSMETIKDEHKTSYSELIDKKLLPIFEEFEQLRGIKKSDRDDLSHDDVRDVLLWRAGLDDKRAILTELGLFIIDATHPTKTWPLLTEALVQTQELANSSQSSEEMGDAEDKLTSVPATQQTEFLTTLKEYAVKLFELLEGIISFRLEIFREIEKLLIHLKSQAALFEDTTNDTLLFANLLEWIKKTERLLEHKQQQANTREIRTREANTRETSTRETSTRSRPPRKEETTSDSELIQ